MNGWLLYDYRGLNPIFADTVGSRGARHAPCVAVDTGEWASAICCSASLTRAGSTTWDLDTTLFINRADMIAKLRDDFGLSGRVAMEYTPEGALPRVSNVDGGRWSW